MAATLSKGQISCTSKAFDTVKLHIYMYLLWSLRLEIDNQFDSGKKFKLYLFYFNYTESSLNLYTRS